MYILPILFNLLADIPTSMVSVLPCFILILITMTGKEWQVPDLPFIDGEEAA